MATKIDKQGILEHNAKFRNPAYPKNNTVEVCSGHGCNFRTPFTFDDALFAKLKEHFEGVNDSKGERDALKKAIAEIEKAAGNHTGTATDKPMFGWLTSGVKSQMDCVDEATNTTHYLIVMHRHGLIKFHDIETPDWKGGLMRWTHFAAIIRDTSTGTRWAIDAGVRGNGGEPLIDTYEHWYT